MLWLIVVLAVAALIMAGKAVRRWRATGARTFDADVAWWTTAAFILGAASALVALLFR